MTNHPTDYGPEPSVSQLQAQIFRLEGEIERLTADLKFSYENKAASDDTWRKECDRLRGYYLPPMMLGEL